MNFPRPRHHRTAPPPRQKIVKIDPRAGDYPRSDLNGTLAALVGVALTAMFVHSEVPSSLARWTAIGVLLSLGMSLYADLRLGGLRNLIRADLMAIFAFYFLTLFEFLFPQSHFDELIDVRTTHIAILCVLLAFAGLLTGRHFFHPTKQPFTHTLTREIPPIWIIVIFWACAFIGYLHMLLAVDWDFTEMVEWWMEPRFSQPWQRGRLGDWKALVNELGLFIYLIPPFAGIIIARRKRYHVVNLALVSMALLLTFFYGFTSGTRNVVASFLVTFLIAYAFALPRERQKELVGLCAASAILMFLATYFMLQFRSVGFRNYVSGDYAPRQSEERVLFVDYNLYAICRLVEVFPNKRPYLGWEIPYQALIRPIPRAMWKGKPDGLSYSIEDAMGVQDMTIAASFAGEAYMAGGLPTVLIIALGFGMLTGWWSHLASQSNSELGILIYASGFFATVISMRSMFVFTTALLPTVAALIIGAYAVHILTTQARILIERAARKTRGRQPPLRRQPPPPRGT